jgi:hypothetical protein
MKVFVATILGLSGAARTWTLMKNSSALPQRNQKGNAPAGNAATSCAWGKGQRFNNKRKTQLQNWGSYNLV